MGVIGCHYGQVCAGTTASGCGLVMRGVRLTKRTRAKLWDEAYLRREKCSGQYMRNLY